MVGDYILSAEDGAPTTRSPTFAGQNLCSRVQGAGNAARSRPYACDQVSLRTRLPSMQWACLKAITGVAGRGMQTKNA